MKGKDITELVAAGREKLASVPCGRGGSGAVAVAASAGGAPAAASAAVEPKKEEKVEEKEESDDVSILGLSIMLGSFCHTLLSAWQYTCFLYSEDTSCSPLLSILQSTP